MDAWDSRIEVIQRMKDIEDVFFNELKVHSFLKGMPTINHFTEYIRLKDSYVLKWEDSTKLYNKLIKEMVEIVSDKYIPITEAGKKEKDKIHKLQMEIARLQKINRKTIMEYEEKRARDLLNKGEDVYEAFLEDMYRKSGLYYLWRYAKKMKNQLRVECWITE